MHFCSCSAEHVVYWVRGGGLQVQLALLIIDALSNYDIALVGQSRSSRVHTSMQVLRSVEERKNFMALRSPLAKLFTVVDVAKPACAGPTYALED